MSAYSHKIYCRKKEENAMELKKVENMGIRRMVEELRKLNPTGRIITEVRQRIKSRHDLINLVKYL